MYIYIYISHVYSWSRVPCSYPTTGGRGTVLWLTHDHGRGGEGGWNAGPYIPYGGAVNTRHGTIYNIYIYVYKRVRVRMQSTGQVRKLFFIALGFVALTASR